MGKPRVTRTIRPGHPKAARAARQWEWRGHLVAVRYYRDEDTGKTWKTVEIRVPKPTPPKEPA